MSPAPLPFKHAAAWGSLAALFALAFCWAAYPNIPPASDVWDYAQEARQLARGEGFTSLYTYPLHLRGDEPPFPVRWRMPLYAAMGAGLLSLGIPLPLGFFAIGVVSHGVLVALVFLLGAHLHSARAGAIGAASAAACPLFLDPYSAGLSQVPAAALALGVWLLLLRGRGVVPASLAAGLAALAWYLRGESLLMAPVWVWAASRGRGWRRGAAFASIYAVICLPWLAWVRAGAGAGAGLAAGISGSIQGNPTLLYTPEYPGHTSSRTYAEPLPGLIEYLAGHPVGFAGRFLKDAAGYGVDLLWGLGPIAVGLGIAGLLLREPGVRWKALLPALPLLVGAAVQIAAVSCLERSPRFLTPAATLVCVALGVAAAPALDRICGRRMVAALFALLLLERGATVAFETRKAARRFPPLPPTLAGELAERTRALPPRGLIWTDSPDWVAWHLDRPAVLLPLWRQRDRVAKDHPAAALFLSPDARYRNLADGEEEWVRVTDDGRAVPGFGPPESLSGGARLYLSER